MIFHILNITTNKEISRYNVRLAGQPNLPNLRIYPLNAPDVVNYRHLPSGYLEDNEEAPSDTEKESLDAFTSSPNHDMPILDPNYLAGRTFLIM